MGVKGRRREMKEINLLSTIQGSMLEDFFPKGWDLGRIENAAAESPRRS